MLKLAADLDRYERVIAQSQPEVLVETGTATGASAMWFASCGLDVITIDVTPVHLALGPRITCVTGDSTHPAVVERVRRVVKGQRSMVSLDSDHSAAHVTTEIALYGPMVSPGCYLVVEDGIFGYADHALRARHGLGGMIGSPLDAIRLHLVDNPDWMRDAEVEGLYPVTHHPLGFWRRNG
jgi:cephalosporin hydroxylase